MDQEKNDQAFGRLCLIGADLADRLDPNLVNAIGTHLVNALDRENNYAHVLWSSLDLLKNRINGDLLHRGTEKLIEAAKNGATPRSALVRTLEGLIDRLEATEARRATEAIVEILEKNQWESSNDEALSRLKLPKDRFTEEKIRELAERLAHVLDQGIVKENVSFYGVQAEGISRAEAIQNVATLLYQAPDQLLLDMLKRPYALRTMREVLLQAWEIKYGQHFENDLWRFVAWARRDPRTSNLNFGP
jgi:hypothetical protein